MIRLSVCFFISISLVEALEETPNIPTNTTNSNISADKDNTIFETTTINTTSESLFVPDVPKYLFKLSALIDDSKVPRYITNLVLNGPSKSNITLDDILTLYGLKEIKLDEFQRLLESLNISSSAVLSAAGFEGVINELELDFKKILNDTWHNIGVSYVKVNIFFQSLKVNYIDFLLNGETYQEFKKGNLTNEAFINAINVINKTTDEFFELLRTQIVDATVLKTPEEILNILQKYGVDRKKLSKLWSILNIESERPHQIAIFENLFRNIISAIDSYSPLGILTCKNQIIINKEVADLFQLQPVKIHTQYLEDNTTWNVSYIQNSSLPNLMVLTLDNADIAKESYAVLSSTTAELQKCIFFSFDADSRTIHYELVPKIHNLGDVLKFNSTIYVSKVVMGSPLVCADTVYGLAKEASSGVVTLTAFVTKDGFTVIPGIVIPNTVTPCTFISCSVIPSPVFPTTVISGTVIFNSVIPTTLLYLVLLVPVLLLCFYVSCYCWYYYCRYNKRFYLIKK